MSDTLSKLPAAVRAASPHLNDAEVAAWVAALAAPMRSSGLGTPRRAAMFIGQVAQESGGFLVLDENLNYSAEALLAVWPSHFPDEATANDYARQPERIANRVYADRLGNGDEASGDGWKFRGAGLIDITGREQFEALAADTHKELDDVLAWVRTPGGAAISACWWWMQPHARPLNPLADTWQITEATRVINGGLAGLSTRIILCNNALKAFE